MVNGDNTKMWNELINQSYEYPEALSGLEGRIEKRIMKQKEKARALFGSVSAVAAVFLFVVLVNTSAAFADKISAIPFISQIVEYVKFDKSLSLAIENNYIQEVGLTAWDGQERLSLPYVIADEKNLVLFFQLPKELKQEKNQLVSVFTGKMTDKITGEKVEGYSYSTSGLTLDERKNNNGLILQRFHFSEGTLPRSVDIEVSVQLETIEADDEAINSAGKSSENQEKTGPGTQIVGNFAFSLNFNEFLEPITYVLNETHTILGQRVTIEEIKVYPTGTEVMFTFDDDNTAWIKGLDLSVEQVGKKTDGTTLGGSGGNSSTCDDENRWMRVYIESNYFEKPKQQELVINAVRLIDKKEEYITVDLDKGTYFPQIEGLSLKSVERKGDKAGLVFTMNTTDKDWFGLFSHQYQDAEGNRYEFSSEGIHGENSVIESFITLVYPSGGK